MTKLLLLLISLSSFLLHGYYFSTGDQSIYIPQVLKLIDPNLYSRDYFVTHSPESHFSLFFSILATTLRFTSLDMQWLYFSLYLLNHTFVIFLLYRLSLTLTRSRAVAILTVLLLSLPRFVGGTTITTLDTAWLPRFAALPLFLFALNQLVVNQPLSSLGLAILTTMIHPFSGLLLFSLIITRQIWRTYAPRLV